MRKKKIVIFSILSILLLVGIFSVTYAYINTKVTLEKTNIVTSGILKVDLKENVPIELAAAYPIEEAAGLASQAFTFQVTNTGNLDASYRIYLDDLEITNAIPEDYLNYSLKKNGSYLSGVQSHLLNYSGESPNRIIDTGEILAGETNSYELRVWINLEAPNSAQGQSWQGRIRIAGEVLSEEDNYCVTNGFTNLSDCMLVMENHAESVESAKSVIEAKTTPSFAKISPELVYFETKSDVSSTATNGITYVDNYLVLAPSYTFDKTTGIFALKNYVSNEEVSDKHIGYYTCWSTGASCTTMYQIKGYKINTTSTGKRYVLTDATRHTYSVVEKMDANIGLYATEDEDGTSYYYRGNIQNNYVSYAGFIWRIIRRNGDGSVRMIYQGKSATDKANPITTQYNTSYWDPTFVGYKYTKDFARKDGTVDTGYGGFNENTIYYFGTNYTYDETTERFTLSGETKSETWEAMHTDAISTYYYTCFGTSATSTCPVLMKITGYYNSKQAKLRFISYSSKSYERTITNTTDSNIKSKLDVWYETNILNKKDSNNNSYASYLSDEVFCNDRSVTSGDGYNLAPTTLYGAYARLVSKKTPSLICSLANDQFTVSTAKGNGALKYPVALITADEVALAGGVNGRVNEKYYLNFGVYYFTMSPSYFDSYNRYARVWRVDPTGTFSSGNTVANTFGVRPVLNLKADVQITSGNGTALNPYKVE